MQPISTSAKLAYGAGSITYAVKDAAFAMFVLLFYKQVLGLSGSLTGLAIFISVLWDAVSDPMIGAWSDRLKSRWGRRHPLLVAGLLPLGLSFVMLFSPIESVQGTQWPLFGWLLMSVISVRTFLTVFIIPHAAMGAELTDDYHERTSIVSFRTNMAWIFGVLLPVLALALLFGSDGDVDGRFVIANYEIYGWASLLVVLLSGGICIWGTRQFIPRLIDVASRGAPSTGFIGMLHDCADTLKNINFRRLLVLDIAVGATLGIQGALHMITMTYFWELSSSEIAFLALASLLATIIVFPTMGRLALRWEKHHLLKYAVAGLAINTMWLVPGRLLGLLPENGTTVLFGLLFLHTLVATIFAIIRSISNHSIMADIADEHELETGRRQEGVFFAAAAFATKFIMGFGYMVTGPLLDLVGLEAGVAPGAAPASALMGIGVVIGPVMALLLLIPWWMAARLDVSRDSLAQVQATLASRASDRASRTL